MRNDEKSSHCRPRLYVLYLPVNVVALLAPSWQSKWSIVHCKSVDEVTEHINWKFDDQDELCFFDVLWFMELWDTSIGGHFFGIQMCFSIWLGIFYKIVKIRIGFKNYT